MKKLNPEDWSPFWKNRTITSFRETFPDNYDGAILDFWRAQLTGRPAHVVDLACGNGALTWICNEILNEGRVRSQITGVDFSDIAPFTVLERDPARYPAVRFIGNTPIENLPFAGGSIDFFVSQYGLEYADPDRAIREIGRTLSPTGRIAFILHDRNSTITRNVTEHLDDFRLVLDEIRMHDLAVELADLFRQYPDPETRARQARFTALMARIRQASGRVDGLRRHHPPNSPLHLYVQRLNAAFDESRRQSDAQRRLLIAQARDGFTTHIRRVEDLRAASLTATDRDRLVSLLEAENLAVTALFTLAYGKEENIGTALCARR